MKTTNRYLLFYAILGVGLALSWSQVGKRAQLAPNANLHIMSVDADCQPLQLPCAAYATDFALVLGPQGGSLRLLGEKLPAGVELHLQHFDHSAHELEAPQFRTVDTAEWLLEPVVLSGRLRASLVLEDQQWIAEFPLTAYQ